jgi:hypothetical protein
MDRPTEQKLPTYRPARPALLPALARPGATRPAPTVRPNKSYQPTACPARPALLPAHARPGAARPAPVVPRAHRDPVPRARTPRRALRTGRCAPRAAPRSDR